jgi:hypothetical protein
MIFLGFNKRLPVVQKVCAVCFVLCAVRSYVCVYTVQVLTPGPTGLTCSVQSNIYVIREQSVQELASLSTAHFLNSHYKPLNHSFGRTMAAVKEMTNNRAAQTFLSWIE